MGKTAVPLVCAAIAVAALIGICGQSVAEERPVILACNDFPPLKIEHPGSDGLSGSDVEAIEEIARRSGLNLKPQFMPWKRGYAEASDGTIDGICSCSYHQDRAALFNFSDPIGETSIGVFHLVDEAPEVVKDMDDLKHPGIGTLGVVKGYNLESELTEAGIPHFAVSDDRQALDMLINHRFNHLYSFRAPIDFMTRRDINIGIAYNQLRNSPYFICLSKKAPETEKMMNRINKAIAEMRNDGAFEMIQSRYGRHPIN